MNKKTIYFLAILIIITVIPACSRMPTVAVTGRVVSSGDYPVYNAMVTVEGRTTYTDKYGYFSLQVRENSYFELKIEKPGYWPVEKYYDVKMFDKYIGTIRINKKIENSGSVSGYIIIEGSGNRFQSLSNMQFPQVSLQNRESIKQLEYVENEVLVKFREGTDIYENYSDSFIKDIIPLNSEKKLYKIISNGKLSTEGLYDYYSKLESVEKVSYNYIGYLMKTPNDTHYNEQWYLGEINMPAAWDIETGSEHVTVAVIDTGYLRHPDLIGNIDTDNDRDFVDKDDDAHDDDDDGHGTHIAGVIGAIGDNQRGVTGVNWKVNILPLRIIKNGRFTTENLLDAIYYAVDKGASVINLSLAYVSEKPDLSSPDNYPIVEDALQYAHESGVTVVAAVGNDGLEHIYYPASSEYTIAVGASDKVNKRAYFSNYGDGLDILAPGVSIYSTYRSNNYNYMTGTSAAAPQVSGIAALLHARGTRHPYEIKDILTGTATPLYDSSLKGVGLLNASAALGDTRDNYSFLKVKIFAAYGERVNGKVVRYHLASNITAADYEGYYELAYVEPERRLQIIAWIDENGDNIINTGDYFGESSEFYLSQGEHRNIDISLEYQNPYTLSIQGGNYRRDQSITTGTVILLEELYHN